MCIKPADGSGEERLLTDRPGTPTSWSHQIEGLTGGLEAKYRRSAVSSPAGRPQVHQPAALSTGGDLPRNRPG
jgi:hypothetical protein